MLGIDQIVSGNPNNLELEVRISSGSAPTESVDSAPRKAGLRVAMDRVRLYKSYSRASFLENSCMWIMTTVDDGCLR